MAAMEQLLEHLHAVRPHSLHHGLEAGNDPVVDIEQSVFAGPVDAGRLDDGQAAAAFGAGKVVGDGIFVEGVTGQVGAVRGANDAVGDFHLADRNRLEHCP